MSLKDNQRYNETSISLQVGFNAYYLLFGVEPMVIFLQGVRSQVNAFTDRQFPLPPVSNTWNYHF